MGGGGLDAVLRGELAGHKAGHILQGLAHHLEAQVIAAADQIDRVHLGETGERHGHIVEAAIALGLNLDFDDGAHLAVGDLALVEHHAVAHDQAIALQLGNRSLDLRGRGLQAVSDLGGRDAAILPQEPQDASSVVVRVHGSS